MHEITERAVCNNRAGWIFWRHSLSEQAKNVRAGWKIIVKIVSEQGLILGTAEYILIVVNLKLCQTMKKKYMFKIQKQGSISSS